MTYEEYMQLAGNTGATSAFGSATGGMMSLAGNALLQHRQFKEQEKLQQRAFQMNQMAVANQAEQMKLGMERAGLNPAGVNGAGAPSIQAGAAAGSTMQLSQVFAGIAEMIQAIKAPAEGTNIEAGTAKTEAETSAIPYKVDNIIAATNKLNAETTNLGNINEVFEARNNFLKDMGEGIFDGYRETLKTTGQFNKLPKRTQATINDLAEGKIQIDIGSLEALDSIINTQSNLSAKDAEILHSMIDSIVTNRQLNDKEVMDAYQKLPKWQQNLMMAQITEYYAMANKAKTEADWNKTRNWLDQHTSDQWLIEHGMSDEIERKKWAELFNNLASLPFNMIEHGAPAVAGASILRNKPVNNKPLLKEVKNTVGKKQNKTTYTYERW